MATALVIARNLKLLRKINRITQQELSSKLELNYRHYQSIEAGKVDLKLSTLERLSDHFKIPIQCFFSPGLSMATMKLDAFDFPSFYVQVYDPQSLNYLNWCRGTSEITGLASFADLTPVSFAYPIQDGRKKALAMLGQVSLKALEKGESQFLWKACLNEQGKLCAPDNAKQLSCFNVTMIATKRVQEDVLVAFSPRNFELMPLP